MGAPQEVRDRDFMHIALRLAERGLGTTAPNPSVGAVIVDEATGEVIARGWTQPGGRPHAETEALRRAGARARGATMFVTLEPCSHHGKTPPCVDAILAAAIARVVCGIMDPDPRVSGRGLDRLRQAGVHVTTRVLARSADWLARGHILRVTERRPFVQLKIALSRDGTPARGGRGSPAWVTGPDARARGHLLRARADAILVGRRTVIDDDPQLTCRLPGLAGRSPVRVVLATGGDVPATSKLVRSARETPVWVVCARGADPQKVEALDTQGCRIVQVESVGGRLWLPAVAEALVAQGITRVLVEGGPEIWRAFSRDGLVDEVVLFQARPEGQARLSDGEASRALARFIGIAGLDLVERARLIGDDMLIWRRTGPHAPGRQDD